MQSLSGFYTAAAGGTAEYGTPLVRANLSAHPRITLHPTCDEPARRGYPDAGPGRCRAPDGSGGASPILRFRTHAELGTLSPKPEDPLTSWAVFIPKSS